MVFVFECFWVFVVHFLDVRQEITQLEEADGTLV